MSIDLHIHSLFSDGTLTPCELVKMARKRGLSAISITDHDTLSGTEETLQAAREVNIEAISGIELSVDHNGTYIHILGYLMDHTSKVLQEKISKLQIARNRRNEKILVKLEALGISISQQEVKTFSKVGQTGRPHIAQALFKKGYVKNINDAFERYLKKGAKAYVSRFVYSAEEVITMIKEAGGLSVLAHPIQIDPTLIKTQKLVDELVTIGLDGIEMYYPTHSAKTRKKIRKITKKHDLIFSGGSDYHGDIRPGTSLAGGVKMYVPSELLDKMKQRLNVV